MRCWKKTLRSIHLEGIPGDMAVVLRVTDNVCYEDSPSLTVPGSLQSDVSLSFLHLTDSLAINEVVHITIP